MDDPSKHEVHLTKEYTRGRFRPSDLQWPVTEVADDFTLYDLFLLIKFADTMISDIPETLGMSEFDLFWKQINLPRDVGDEDDVSCLELYWGPDYEVRTTPKTDIPTDQPSHSNAASRILGNDTENYWSDPKIAEMSNLMSFHGTGPGCPSKDYHKCDSDCPTETPYGIEFTTLNNLAHLPIRTLPTVEFYPPYIESDRDFKRTGFQLTIYPTLWCFITSILWELTFAGSTPNEISDKTKEIQEAVDEAKKLGYNLEETHE